jgi:hypothetical protein
MPTIHLKGPGLNYYFAESMVEQYGPEEAKERSSGPMLKAVERVIARREAEQKKENDSGTGTKT